MGFFCPEKSNGFGGFEPANLGTKGQDATSRPPKPLYMVLELLCILYTRTTNANTPYFSRFCSYCGLLGYETV